MRTQVCRSLVLHRKVIQSRIWNGEDPASVSKVAKYIAIGAGGLGFGSHVDQVRRSVANGSPPLRRFFGVVLSKR